MSSTTQPRMMAPSRPLTVWPYRLPGGCPSPGQVNPQFFKTDPVHSTPISQRWQSLSQNVNSPIDLRPVDWQPQQYPHGFQTDPTYYMRYPYWGSNYIYYRPYYQSPTGACVTDAGCTEGVAASGCLNFDNSRANAFYSGKSCQEVKRITGKGSPTSSLGDFCNTKPKGCWA